MLNHALCSSFDPCIPLQTKQLGGEKRDIPNGRYYWINTIITLTKLETGAALSTLQHTRLVNYWAWSYRGFVMNLRISIEMKTKSKKVWNRTWCAHTATSREKVIHDLKAYHWLQGLVLSGYDSDAGGAKKKYPWKKKIETSQYALQLLNYASTPFERVIDFFPKWAWTWRVNLRCPQLCQEEKRRSNFLKSV